LTSFKPNYDLKQNEKFFLFSKIRKKNEIICKNFLTFFVFLKHIDENKKFFSVLVKKKKKKNITMLRAPYRYKIARYQIAVVNYKLRVKIKIGTDSLMFGEFNNILQFINLNKLYYS